MLALLFQVKIFDLLHNKNLSFVCYHLWEVL